MNEKQRNEGENPDSKESIKKQLGGLIAYRDNLISQKRLPIVASRVAELDIEINSLNTQEQNLLNLLKR